MEYQYEVIDFSVRVVVKLCNQTYSRKTKKNSMTFKQTKFAIKKSRETVLLFHLSASFKFHVNLKAFQKSWENFF